MNLFENILNRVGIGKQPTQAPTIPQAPIVPQKPSMTLFSDEQQMFQKMKADNLSDEQSFSLLKKRRSDLLGGNTQLTPDEQSMLLKMQADNLSAKEATAMIQKRRKDQFEKKYSEGNLLQKGAYNTLMFAAGNAETALKYGGNILDFATLGKAGFGDDVKRMEQVTQSPEFDSTARKVGSYLPDVALSVSPLGGSYLAGAKGMTNLALRSGVVGAGFGAAQPILDKGSEATMGDIATGGAIGAGVGVVATPVISKTLKYGKAGYYGGVTGMEKSISRDIKSGVQAITPSGANISTRANRFNANEIREFMRTTGQSPGDFATSRGMTKVGDDAVVEATNLWKKSMDQADEGLQAIKGRFRFTDEGEDLLKTTMDDLETRLINTKSPDAKRISQLKAKYESSGLTMSEINEVKRLYSNNYKYSFVDAGSEGALRSRNLQDAIRKWQFKVAEENGLTNLKEINKTTQGWKMFADSLSKKIRGSSGNNNVSLTDWIALSGGGPENIALYLGKKLASSDTVKRGAIKLFSKQTKPSIIQASMGDIQNSNFLKNVNRGVSGVGDNSGGKSLVRPVGLLPAPSGKATGARNVRVNQPMEKAGIKPDITSKSKIVRPTTKPKEGVVVPKAPIVKKETIVKPKEVNGNIRPIGQSKDFIEYFRKDLGDNVTMDGLKKFGFTESQIKDNSYDFLKSKDNPLGVSLEDLFYIAKGNTKGQTPAGPTTFNTSGKKVIKKTPESPVALERGYTTSVKKPIVKRASDIDGVTMYRGQTKAGNSVQYNDTNFQGNTEGGVFFTIDKTKALKYGDNIIEIKSTKGNTVSIAESKKLQKMAEIQVEKDIKNMVESDELIEQMALGRPKAFAEYTKKPFVETGDMFGEPGEMIYYKHLDNNAVKAKGKVQQPKAAPTHRHSRMKD